MAEWREEGGHLLEMIEEGGGSGLTCPGRRRGALERAGLGEETKRYARFPR
jgi:hypothetical protein